MANKKSASGDGKTKKEKKKPEWWKELAAFNWKWWHPVVVILVGIVIHVVVDAYRNPLKTLNATDDDQMKGVFFKGDPWAVMCHGDNTDDLGESFEAAADHFKGDGQLKINFGMLDCDAKMSSGRSVFERWKKELNPKVRPTVFVVSKKGNVTQLARNKLKSQYTLIKSVREAAFAKKPAKRASPTRSPSRAPRSSKRSSKATEEKKKKAAEKDAPPQPERRRAERPADEYWADSDAGGAGGDDEEDVEDLDGDDGDDNDGEGGDEEDLEDLDEDEEVEELD